MDVSRTDTTRTQSHSAGWWSAQIAGWIVAAPFWYFTVAILATDGGWIAAAPAFVALMAMGTGDTFAKIFERLDRR